VLGRFVLGGLLRAVLGLRVGLDLDHWGRNGPDGGELRSADLRWLDGSTQALLPSRLRPLY
jgi:hypothetical protein